MVEGQREHSDAGRQKVEGNQLIMVQKQLFYALIVGVVEEGEVFDVVVHQRQLSEGFNVAQADRGEAAVVGEDELAFGCGGESQTAACAWLEDHNLLLEVVVLREFLLEFALLQRVVSPQRYLRLQILFKLPDSPIAPTRYPLSWLCYRLLFHSGFKDTFAHLLLLYRPLQQRTVTVKLGLLFSESLLRLYERQFFGCADFVDFALFLEVGSVPLFLGL